MDPHSPAFKLVFGILGNMIGVGVNLAPMGTFWNIFKNRDSQSFSGLPYVFSLTAAMIWVLYAIPSVTADAYPIITINVASSAIQIFYIIIYLTFAEKKPKRELIKVMGACFLWVAILAVLTLKVVPQDRRSLTVGSTCVVIGVVTYASPLSVAGMVIQTRSVKFLPIVLCTFLFINSLIWTCYGIITRDIFVLIPNGVGVAFGVAQLSLYAWYRNAKPLDEFSGKSKNGDASVEAIDDKSFDKLDEKSAIDDKSFDKLDEKSVKGDGNCLSPCVPSPGNCLSPCVSSHGNCLSPCIPSHGNCLSPCVPSHISLCVVDNV